MYGLFLFALIVLSGLLIKHGLKVKSTFRIVSGIALGLLSLGFFWFMGFWTEALWFYSVNFNNRFWLEIYYGSVLGIAGALIATVCVFGLTVQLPRSAKLMRIIAVIIAVLAGGFWGYGNWEVILKYWESTPTTVFDPIFGMNTSFYLFTLPFLDSVQFLLFFISFIGFGSSIIAAFIRLNEDGVYFYVPPIAESSTNKLHNSLYINAAVLIFVLTFGKLIDKYHLMYSGGGVVTGPGWTDANILIPAYNLIVVFMLIVGISLLIPNVRKRYKGFFGKFGHTPSNSPIFVLSASGAAIILVWFLGLSVVPGAFESFVVKPNEITYERPYIEHNIEFTKNGFGINKVEEKEFPENGTFSLSTVENNPMIFNNVRLWDWRALDATYRQFQGFRLYYQFTNVDVDRYNIDGKYRQVMVSAREMNINNLPQQSQTFINRRFQYTHGYGITMATVNEFTPQGLPHLLIKDIPSESESSELDVNTPQIYYGELTKTPVIVNSKNKEFDYPNGSDNVYTRYNGTGGVQITSLWRKFLFGWKFDGTKLLFSDYPTENSRLMFHREVGERVRLLAPFLKFDNDPYVVLNKGKLYWIIDAYTASGYYPYSEPFSSSETISFKEGNKEKNLSNQVNKNFNGDNYIRNSVKVIVDAFNGSVNFYIMDENDPIINVWNKIYPELFNPKSELPSGLLAHIRYPKDMLLTQGLVYQKYHMTDPTVFYNQEDLWVRATEKYYSNVQPVEPYYIIWQLPESDTPQFSLILPFTPKNRQVLIGWIAGLCDPENYGKLVTYQFPKGRMVPGTQQVETKIDQDSYLSGQLTLWDQRGSNVIRGNVLAIPVENTLIYVEPIYLQAETAAYPELRLVVVMHGDEMSYAESFEGALKKLFASKSEIPEQALDTSQSEESTSNQLIEKANSAFNNYLKLSGEKRFSEAAKELESLQKTLEQLKMEADKK